MAKKNPGPFLAVRPSTAACYYYCYYCFACGKSEDRRRRSLTFVTIRAWFPRPGRKKYWRNSGQTAFWFFFFISLSPLSVSGVRGGGRCHFIVFVPPLSLDPQMRGYVRLPSWCLLLPLLLFSLRPLGSLGCRGEEVPRQEWRGELRRLSIICCAIEDNFHVGSALFCFGPLKTFNFYNCL